MLKKKYTRGFFYSREARRYYGRTSTGAVLSRGFFFFFSFFLFIYYGVFWKVSYRWQLDELPGCEVFFFYGKVSNKYGCDEAFIMFRGGETKGVEIHIGIVGKSLQIRMSSKRWLNANIWTANQIFSINKVLSTTIARAFFFATKNSDQPRGKQKQSKK